MNESTIEILNLVSSFLTPLIVLILGIAINRKLEIAKTALSKEKDWQNWWASEFLRVCRDYNSCITDVVVGLYQWAQIQEEKLPGWEDEAEKKLNSVRQAMRELQRLEWEIQNYARFAHNHGDSVLKNADNLFKLTAELIDKLKREKRGNVEPIRQAQFEFNQAVRLAHAEILGLPRGFVNR
jgi:pyruvate/2-oxoacid:ferredoxin oxidoreductase alpha subunit